MPREDVFPASRRVLPPLATTELLSHKNVSRPSATKLPVGKRGINLDEGLPFGDPWAVQPQRSANGNHLLESSGSQQLANQSHNLDRRNRPCRETLHTSSSRLNGERERKMSDCPSIISDAHRAPSNKRRRRVFPDDGSGFDGSTSPLKTETSFSSVTDSSMDEDDRRACVEEESPRKTSATFRDRVRHLGPIFSSSTSSESRVSEVNLQYEHKEHSLCKIERPLELHRPTQRTLADVKRKVHANNEYVRRREETRKIYKIDELLPSELLIDVRMGNLKQGHTKLQILSAAVAFMGALSKEAKQCALEKCREDLSKEAGSQECYLQMGSSAWDTDTGLDGLPSLWTQTPPPSNCPSPGGNGFI